MPSLNLKEGTRENNALVRFLYWTIDAVDYTIEFLRGIILDPIGSMLKRCFRYLKRILRPKSLKERSVLYQIKDPTKSRYCMSGVPLSFFDPFSCFGGVPAYHLTRCNENGRCESDTASTGIGASNDEITDAKTEESKAKTDSVFETQSSESIAVCCFSSDSSKFAICYVSGEVTIWDTNHGSLIVETRIEDSPATSISFLGNKSSVLLIYTKDYALWRWDVDTGGPHQIKTCDRGTPARIDGEVTSQRSNFYKNGERFLLSTIINAQSGRILELASMNILAMDSWLSFSMYLQREYVISKTVISHKGSSILVGFVDRDLNESYCLLWPSYNEAPTSYKRLNKGTIGSWSLDSKHVVTWIMTNGPDSNVKDGNSAFIWNVEKMRENLTNADYSFKPKTITNPFGSKVLWCQMTHGWDEKDRLIMSISGEFTRVLFWDVKTSTHTHTVETGISPKDMMLCKKEAWIESCVNKKSVKGLCPMDVTSDGSMFGAVLGLPSELLLWDAHLGVRVLKISLKDLLANKIECGINLIMSSSSAKFAIIGKDEVIVFNPSSNCKNKQRPRHCVETQMVQLDNPYKSEANLSSFKMGFSCDGDTLGVLRIGSSKMQVWNLPQGSSCTIESALNEEGGNIQDFCLSNNGQYLVLNTGKSIQIMNCKDKDMAQTIGVLDIESKVVSMGINEDTSELVLCMKDGGICWYKLSRQAMQHDEENVASTSNNVEFIGQDLSFMERIKSWFKRPSVGVREPLFDNNDADGQSSSGHTSIHIRHRAPSFTYTKHVLAEELDEATFQVSPNANEVIRISESNGVEAWDLETKMKLFGPFKETSFIERKVCAYSHVSSITEQVHDELVSRKNEFLDGTGIDLSEKTTLVQSSEESIIVTGNCSLRSVSHWSDQSTFNAQYESNECDDSSSVYVLNLNDQNSTRRLSGKSLRPDKGLTISNDGRHVACLADKFASKVIVWNTYASEGLLPDYHALALNHAIESKKVIRREIVPIIDRFGVNFFNFRHANKASILDEAVWFSSNELLRTILKYASKKEVKVSFVIKNNTQIWVPEVADYVKASIVGRSPETLKLIVQYLLKRVWHDYEMAKVLADSLCQSLREYPQIFHIVVQDPGLLGTGHKIKVAQVYLKGHKFGVRTSSSLNMSEGETRKLWKEDQGSNIGLSPSIGWTLPYKGACNIGANGLLREMIMNEAHHSLYGSLAISAVVQYKWRVYARRLFIHEICHYCLVALSFSVYCFVLCIDETYVIGQPKVENEEDTKLTIMALLVSCLLALPCLFRELCQCTMYIINYNLRGFVFWLKSGWNWIELLSYLNLIIVVPLGQHFHLHEGKDTTRLSAVVAIESLLLWSRVLFYARPFSSTGPIVTTVTSIVREIISFVVLALCVMFGFALAFRVLYRHVECIEEDEGKNFFQYIESNNVTTKHLDYMHMAFGTFRRSFFTVFGYTFGNFEMNVLYYAPEMVTATILFVLYMVIIAIIFLNMLIALMSDKFTRIHKNRRTRVIEARAKAIDDIDSMLSYFRKKQLSEEIGEYLHIAAPYLHHERIAKPSILRPILSLLQKKTEKKKTKKKSQSPSRAKDIRGVTYSVGPSHQHPMHFPDHDGASFDISETEHVDQCEGDDREMEGHWYDSDSSISDFDQKYSDEDDE